MCRLRSSDEKDGEVENELKNHSCETAKYSGRRLSEIRECVNDDFASHRPQWVFRCFYGTVAWTEHDNEGGMKTELDGKIVARDKFGP